MPPPPTTPADPSVPGPRSLGELYWAFTILALQGFGGVLAVVQRELVERRRWLTLEEFIEDWAVAQILPGPNGVNMSVMRGDRYFGWRGALAGFAGMLSVPLVVVLIRRPCSVRKSVVSCSSAGHRNGSPPIQLTRTSSPVCCW